MLIGNTIVQRIVGFATFPVLVCATMTGAYANVDWQPCMEKSDSAYECATVDVPLNYQKYDGNDLVDNNREHVVSIALARLPALDSENKKGTLFFNPGGPGGSGINLLLEAGQMLFTEKIRKNYDIVGFDPRGIDRSQELTCFYNSDEVDKYFSEPDLPVTPDQVNRREELDWYLSDFCGSRAGEMINHMSTADVARDLDLLRQAVGDEKLYFVGYSYGSYLGVTYANLFPDNVGRMILDGVIDPVAWSTGRNWASYFFPVTTRIRSAEGASDTLNEFFRLCDEAGIEVCPLAGDAESRYASVLQSLREEPIVHLDENGSEFVLDYAQAVKLTHAALYHSESWPDLASSVVAVVCISLNVLPNMWKTIC
jgi:pimeloyl-ACP methyl ester carboxylesterase